MLSNNNKNVTLPRKYNSTYILDLGKEMVKTAMGFLSRGLGLQVILVLPLYFCTFSTLSARWTYLIKRKIIKQSKINPVWNVGKYRSVETEKIENWPGLVPGPAREKDVRTQKGSAVRTYSMGKMALEKHTEMSREPQCGGNWSLAHLGAERYPEIETHSALSPWSGSTC